MYEADAIHGDFKCENILINDGIYKIADLGSARTLKKDQLALTILGTTSTMAP